MTGTFQGRYHVLRWRNYFIPSFHYRFNHPRLTKQVLRDTRHIHRTSSVEASSCSCPYHLSSRRTTLPFTGYTYKINNIDHLKKQQYGVDRRVINVIGPPRNSERTFPINVLPFRNKTKFPSENHSAGKNEDFKTTNFNLCFVCNFLVNFIQWTMSLREDISNTCWILFISYRHHIIHTILLFYQRFKITQFFF